MFLKNLKESFNNFGIKTVTSTSKTIKIIIYKKNKKAHIKSDADFYDI